MTPGAKLRASIEAAKTAYEQETGSVITEIRVRCHEVQMVANTYTLIEKVEVEVLAQMGEARG